MQSKFCLWKQISRQLLFDCHCPLCIVRRIMHSGVSTIHFRWASKSTQEFTEPAAIRGGKCCSGSSDRQYCLPSTQCPPFYSSNMKEEENREVQCIFLPISNGSLYTYHRYYHDGWDCASSPGVLLKPCTLVSSQPTFLNVCDPGLMHLALPWLQNSPLQATHHHTNQL